MISSDSRYTSCIIFKEGAQESLGIRKRIDSTPRPDDRFHIVIEGDRIDVIAFRYLFDCKLWWIIADYNDLFFVLELPVGIVLRIPSIEHVHMRILS
jgi:hypothetical protein